MSKRHPIPPLRGHKSRADRLTWSNDVHDWSSEEQKRTRDSQQRMGNRPSGGDASDATDVTDRAEP
jgi:hypothetical protein